MNKIDEYISELDGALRPIAEKLREIVLSVDATLVEEIKWHVPTYAVEGKSFCSIMAHTHHVNLQLFHGTELMDVKLLDGTGKGMRHLKFSTVDDIDANSVTRLVKEAAALERNK